MTGNPKQDDFMPGTSWALIAAAKGAPSEAQHRALSQLLLCYAPALEAHLVRNGMAWHAAEDLVQGFIADKLLGEGILAHADASRGRFRNFLLTALDNYIRNQRRDAECDKRAAGKLVPLQETDQEQMPAPSAAPDAFDTDWARCLIGRSIARMKAHCLFLDRPDVWEMFSARLLEPLFGQAKAPSYDALAARFGLESPNHGAKLIASGKHMFHSTLRECVAEYELPERVEGEVTDLLRTLCAMHGEGREAHGGEAAGDCEGGGWGLPRSTNEVPKLRFIERFATPQA